MKTLDLLVVVTALILGILGLSFQDAQIKSLETQVEAISQLEAQLANTTSRVVSLENEDKMAQFRDVLLQGGQRVMYDQMKELHPEAFGKGNPFGE